ncbi:hypothetical protein Syun_025513 [Stephania yunnanensis]|uniref:Uncharacterized protein n=1 Tax=Stephania yunnanensis TaxID=152371 RepID=A0AAP0EYZ2_9MAGN
MRSSVQKRHHKAHRILCEKWWSKSNLDYVRPCKSREEVVRNVPKDMDPHDWEWLVSNKYLTAKFKEASDCNSINRSKAIKMPHHSGSKPHRELKRQKEEKMDVQPTQDEMLFLTRQKGGHFVEQAAKDKYVIKIDR